MWPARTTIPAIDGSPKFHRYYLIGTGATGGLLLHHFVASDAATELHDHPWGWGISVMLAGGYREVRRGVDGALRARWRGRGSIRAIRGDEFHRVELVEGRPAWTLFLHGPSVKRWGFLDLATGVIRIWTRGAVVS
jgi:hypothetical protein